MRGNCCVVRLPAPPHPSSSPSPGGNCKTNDPTSLPLPQKGPGGLVFSRPPHTPALSSGGARGEARPSPSLPLSPPQGGRVRGVRPVKHALSKLVSSSRLVATAMKIPMLLCALPTSVAAMRQRRRRVDLPVQRMPRGRDHFCPALRQFRWPDH